MFFDGLFTTVNGIRWNVYFKQKWRAYLKLQIYVRSLLSVGPNFFFQRGIVISIFFY